MRHFNLILYVCIMTVLMHFGCDKDDPVSPENRPPVIESITSSPSTSISNRLAGGSTVLITVIATDPDGDELFYKWEAEEGQFDGDTDKLTVRWISPFSDKEADCVIKVMVSDGMLTTQGNITVCVDKTITPTVSTSDITDITENSASSGGNVTDSGGLNVIARGVLWSTRPEPTLESKAGYTTDGTGTGTFTSNITGLEPNTEYYVRAYATNDAGTGYGAQIQFMTKQYGYSISGRVTEDGTGMGGVTITASDGHSQTVKTNSNGDYTITGVAHGSNVTITPDSADYEFNPQYHSISNITQNHTGIDFTGTLATSASISVSPTSHDYGNVVVDQNSSKTFTIQNTGTASMSGEISLTGTHADQYRITNGGGSYTISAGDSRNVTVEFNPTSTGTKNGILRIIHNATNTSSPVNVSLAGEGVTEQVATISVSPESHNYGEVTVDQTSTQTFTIHNTGSASMSGEISLTGTHADQYTITNGGGSYTISADDSRNVTVEFHPTSTGTKNGILRITHNATNTSSPVNVLLAGEGVTEQVATISVSPESHNYGEVTVDQTSTQIFTIHNTGSASMSGQISLTGTHADQYTITSGGGSYTINADGSRNVTVRFNPKSTGRKDATLRITHDATNTLSPVDVTLRGEGVPAFYSISGRVTEGGSGLGGVTITASGGHSQTVTTNSNGEYTVTGVPHGATVTITPTRSGYSFTPQSRSISNITQNQTDIDFTAEKITYTISGRVRIGHMFLADVAIYASGGHSQKVTTNHLGQYTISGVPHGATVTITPVLYGYDFTPQSRSISNITHHQTGIDFVASKITYSISGRVTEAGYGLEGVKITASGDFNMDVTTYADGGYTFLGVPQGANVTITPALDGYSFTPQSRSISNISQNQTGIDFDAARITYRIWGMVTEGGSGLGGVTIEASGGHSQTVTTFESSINPRLNGLYTLTGVPHGATVTITPRRSGYSFTPQSRSISNITEDVIMVNFIATKVTYNISGRVTLGDSGLEGVTIEASGDHSQTVTTNSNGYYTVTGVSHGATVTITPTHGLYMIFPGYRTITNITQNQTAIDFYVGT